MAYTKEKIEIQNAALLSKICPVVAEKVVKLIALAESEGYHLIVTAGLRTWAEQSALYNQGRSKPGKRVTNAKAGQSFHNYGIAVDLAFVTGGAVDWTDALYHKIGVWAEKVGLRWGGGWDSRFKDLPHVEQIDKLSIKSASALYKKGGLAEVWKQIK